MDLTCPRCQQPTDMHGSLDEDGHLLSACPTCHLNVLLLAPRRRTAQETPTAGPERAPVARTTGSPPRQRRLARWLSVSTFLVNLTIIGAILAGSALAVRTIYDPYDLDQHVLTPLVLRMDGWTDLHLAAARGQADEVARLVADGAEVDAVTGKGRTALFEAAKRGHVPVVTLLLEHGARLDVVDKVGKTPLMESTQYGHEEVVRLLVARGAALDLTEPAQGNTALHLAAQANHGGAARRLLAGGARVDSRNRNLETPLHTAAEQSWHETAAVAVLLIDAQADLEARDRRGFTPLIRAAQHGHLPVLSALISHRADPNAKTHRGRSALYEATGAGRYRVAELLLDEGADPNVRCDCGSTPLHRAVQSGDERLVALLLDRGARINARVSGNTALHLAEERRLHAIAVVLKERGGTTYPAIHEHVSRALELSQRGAHADAAEQYSRALELDATDAELYYLRGTARLRMREHGGAYEDFERSLELDPNRIDAYVKAAHVLALQQDWDGVIAQCDRLLAREPRHAPAYYERARAYFSKSTSRHDAGAQAQAVADALRSCELGYEAGCKTYASLTGSPAS